MIWSVLKYVVLVVVVSVLLWMAATTVYQTGYDKAQAEGNAALAALGKMYADANADRWAEYAAKEREARERLQDEQEKANALEAALLETKIALADERRGFAKRIADATRNDDCMLSADAVRLYNEALYGPDGTANAGSKHNTAGAAHPAESTQSSTPIGAGILRRQSVNIKDLLAHAKLYGEWAREVYAIAQGWNTFVPEQPAGKER